MNALSQLSHLLLQTEIAQQEHTAVRLACVGKPKPPKKLLGSNKIAIAILIPLALIFLSEVHPLTGMIAILGFAGLVLVLGIVALVRKKEKIRAGVSLILSGLVFLGLFLVSAVGKDVGLFGALGLLLGLPVGSYYLGALWDVHLIKVNEEIAAENQEAYDAAYRAAAPQLLVIEKKWRLFSVNSTMVGLKLGSRQPTSRQKQLLHSGTFLTMDARIRSRKRSTGTSRICIMNIYAAWLPNKLPKPRWLSLNSSEPRVLFRLVR